MDLLSELPDELLVSAWTSSVRCPDELIVSAWTSPDAAAAPHMDLLSALPDELLVTILFLEYAKLAYHFIDRKSRISTAGVQHMTRTQAGVNMVPGAERRGCSARRDETSQLDLPNPNPERQCRTNKNSNIVRAITGDTTSSQDSAFKKEDDVGTPSLSGLGEPDLGFPLGSKRGAAEGHGSVSKKKNDTHGRRRCQHRQAEQGSLPGLS
jgi:hypothetical protein